MKSAEQHVLSRMVAAGGRSSVFLPFFSQNQSNSAYDRTKNVWFVTEVPFSVMENVWFVTENVWFVIKNPFSIAKNVLFLAENVWFVTENPSLMTKLVCFETKFVSKIMEKSL
jgi:hypothetical protein